ncbi:MAG: efflux RND transporter periplasmic adaptor subunit [Victivallaceae bacterium]|nr:efflux RND transporter periplasmic adaptor subunit [Victivallaceae bacterium]
MNGMSRTLFLVIAMAAAFPGSALLAAAPPRRPAPTVGVSESTLIYGAAAREYIGSVKAYAQVNVNCRVSGFIGKTLFREGGMVKKGDLLITIEDTTYRAKADAAKANVAASKAELEYAKTEYNRNERLAKGNAISQSKLDDARRALDLAEAKLAKANADLLDAENDLSYTKLYAPLAGRVGKSRFSSGNYVTPNSDPVVTITRVDQVYITVSLSERDYLDYGGADKIGETADLEVRLANGQICDEKGYVAFTDNTVDSGTGTLRIWTVFQNAKKLLTPGGFVTMAIRKKSDKKQVSVPVTAVLTDAKGDFVYVVGPDNLAKRRNVRLGETVGMRRIVLKNLSVGEKIICDGTNKVIPGMPVVPVASEL